MINKLNLYTPFAVFAFFLSNPISAQEKVRVKLDKPENGQVILSPSIPEDGNVVEGTVFTIKAIPDDNFVIDATYSALPGRFGLMYEESQNPETQVFSKKNMHFGASFIEKSVVENITVSNNVIYAKPGVKSLKYDVYAPKNAKNLPCIVIIHGGGWTSNNEDIMRGLAREFASTGKYVVFSIDYRWLGKLDGDATDNRYYNLIEDCYGAIAHIMENAGKYGGDSNILFLTGDSAGGHLSASVTDFCERIGDKGFGKIQDVYEFKPSYLPKNKTISQVKKEITTAIKAVAPSYGVFNAKTLEGLAVPEDKDLTILKQVAPANHIPNAKKRKVPQFLLRGTTDPLISDQEVKTYVIALEKAGQRAEYMQVEGASHAFFDWKPPASVKETFAKYGVPYAKKMMAFFESVKK